MEYEIATTCGKGDATEITRRAAESYDGHLRVYACGGDGTLNEVINGAALHENTAVCAIPVGSGNDFIKTFDGIPKEKFLDLAACIGGEETPCDLMRVDDKYSINIISVGLDAVTGMRQGKCKKIPFISGSAAYKVALGASFLTAMKNKISFDVDGEPVDLGTDYVTLGVFGNGRWYGGGFKATPYAEINDGLMDFITIRTISRLEFLKYVGIYKKGEHIEKMPAVKYMRCRKVKMFSEHPIIIQLDGEIYSLMNPEIELVPNAARIILPKTDN